MLEKKNEKKKKNYNSTSFGIENCLQRASFSSCPEDSIDVVDEISELGRCILRCHIDNLKIIGRELVACNRHYRVTYIWE
jgi:hypothetical protein